MKNILICLLMCGSLYGNNELNVPQKFFELQISVYKDFDRMDDKLIWLIWPELNYEKGYGHKKSCNIAVVSNNGISLLKLADIHWRHLQSPENLSGENFSFFVKEKSLISFSFLSKKGNYSLNIYEENIKEDKNFSIVIPNERIEIYSTEYISFKDQIVFKNSNNVQYYLKFKLKEVPIDIINKIENFPCTGKYFRITRFKNLLFPEDLPKHKLAPIETFFYSIVFDLYGQVVNERIVLGDKMVGKMFSSNLKYLLIDRYINVPCPFKLQSKIILIKKSVAHQ